MPVVPFEPIHLNYLNLIDEQAAMKHVMFDQEYQELLMTGPAYTGFYKGQVVICSGVFPVTNYMAKAWVLMSRDIGPGFLEMTRAVGDFLQKCDYDRVETPILRSYVNGHRWAKMLGFVNETPETGMRYYGFHGETYDLYGYYPKELKNGRDYIKTKST